jgi:hypothetical protein
MRVFEFKVENKNFLNLSDIVDYIKKLDEEIDLNCFIKIQLSKSIATGIQQVSDKSAYGDDYQYSDTWNLDFMDDINKILYISKRYKEYDEEEKEEEEIGECTDEFFWHCNGTRKNGQCLNCGHYSLNQYDDE